MSLKIAFIHYNVQYKNGRENRLHLLTHMREAAVGGAQIILTPEMAVSGYSFKDRADICEQVESEDSEFINEINAIAEEFGCYICVGLALLQEETGAYCNSAIVVGPGNFFQRYDKINGEVRWARPGDPNQSNCFDTPWGRIGILICSDTYYDLQPRITALRGADLLLVPANWPPSGLDPVELWRARAVENGIAIAGCNRTGKDLNMCCESAESCLISSAGEVLFRQSSPKTAIFVHCLPLVGGKLDSNKRKERLKSRRVENYHSCYKNINIISDLTSFFDLPASGELAIHCLVNSKGTATETLDKLAATSREYNINDTTEKTSLWLLSLKDLTAIHLENLQRIARENGIWISIQVSGETSAHLFGPESYIRTEMVTDKAQPSHIDIGPARVAFMPYSSILHPENSVAASKDGCDLIVVGGERFTEEEKLICGARSINHLVVAMCNDQGGGIWMRPEGHARWGEILQEKSGVCNFVLNTELTRKKHFQDRLDLDRLFREEE